jgi:hypothetical protein
MTSAPESPRSRARLLRQPRAAWGITLAVFATLISGVRASTLLDPRPEASTTLFGRAVAAIGDVDRDGKTDLAVGAPFQDGDFSNIHEGFGPPQNVGKVYLISGATLAVIRELNDPQFQKVQDLMFGGQFGSSVAAAGDLNHDGISEIIVGVPHHIVTEGDEDAINAGRAFIFSGRDGRLLLTLDDPEPNEGTRFGSAVAGIDDVNADGIPDVAIGAPKRDLDPDLDDAGLVYIFSGADGSVIRSLTPPDGGLEIGGRFGAAVANAGDVVKDGVSDLLIGAPGCGRAFVFSGQSGGLLFTLKSPAAERLRSFGFAVAGGKDLNRDGIPDFAIGAPLQDGLRGAVYLFSGADGKLLRKLTATQQAFAKFGTFVAMSDDLTGDRRPDVLVGAPDQSVGGNKNVGQAFIFSGANGKVVRTVTATTPKAFAGFGSVVTTADTNGDGILETIIGAPFQDADLMDETGDIETHLQIGQIEIQ